MEVRETRWGVRHPLVASRPPGIARRLLALPERLEQREVDLGTIVFGATRARASVLLWREAGSKTPIAADFELVEKIADFWSQSPADASSVRDTMTGLQAAAGGWLGSMPTQIASHGIDPNCAKQLP